jgi:hypothetical protein
VSNCRVTRKGGNCGDTPRNRSYSRFIRNIAPKSTISLCYLLLAHAQTFDGRLFNIGLNSTAAMLCDFLQSISDVYRFESELFIFVCCMVMHNGGGRLGVRRIPQSTSQEETMGLRATRALSNSALVPVYFTLCANVGNVMIDKTFPRGQV